MLKTSPTRWFFWLKWVLLNVVASFAGVMVGATVFSSIRQAVPNLLSGRSMEESGFAVVLNSRLVIAVHFVSGIIIGLIQRSILQPWIRQQREWVLATAVGWSIGSAMVVLLSSIMPYTFTRIILTGALLGVLLGTLQWLVLRRWVNQAYWWILSGIVSMTIASTLSGMFLTPFLGDAIGLALMGLPLVWLLPSPASKMVQLTEASS
jgi:hypothetical protein